MSLSRGIRINTVGQDKIMNWPGEDLLIKLWESLADKGVGSLLRPWQIRREGRANIDLQRYEMLALADAEREVEEIRSGRRCLENAKYVLSITKESHEVAPPPSAQVPVLEIANRIAVADAVRKEVNVAKAVLHAEDDLKNDPAPTPKKKVEEDWLCRWRDYAGSVSSDDLQQLWGRILAGEVKSPGSYAYRLLDFVRNLTTEEAGLIERIAPFVLNGLIFREPNDLLTKAGVSFYVLMELQDLGVISGVEAVGLQVQYTSTDKTRYVRLLTNYGKGLLIEHEDTNKRVDMGIYSITNLGKQVLGLGKFSPNDGYLIELGRAIKKRGFKVSIVDCTDVGLEMVKCSNAVEIKDAQDERQQPPLAGQSVPPPVT
jgi:hypothetical protein